MIYATDIDSAVLSRGKEGGPFFDWQMKKKGGGIGFANEAERRGFIFSEPENPAPNYWVSSEIRRSVTFEKLDLLADEYPAYKDVIFCRNAMLHLDSGSREIVAKKLYASLIPGGYLFVANDEISFVKSAIPKAEQNESHNSVFRKPL